MFLFCWPMTPFLCACHYASAPIWLLWEVMPPPGLRQLHASSQATPGHLATLPTVEDQISSTSYPSRMTRGRHQRLSFGHPGHRCLHFPFSLHLGSMGFGLGNMHSERAKGQAHLSTLTHLMKGLSLVLMKCCRAQMCIYSMCHIYYYKKKIYRI